MFASDSLGDTDSNVVDLGGSRFRPTTSKGLAAAVDRVQRDDSLPPLTIGYVNPHVIATAATSAVVTAHLERCDHVCVDGVGVWLAALVRGVRTERLRAHRAFDDLLLRGAFNGKMLVIGIEAEFVDAAAARIAASAPDLDVVGTVDGFAPDASIASALAEVGAVDVVIIGAGSPRSEHIAELVVASGQARIVMHVGAGTLKVHAGERQHPPEILDRSGLGWIHRLITEPHTRHRYLVGIPAFVRLVLRPPTPSRGVTS